MAPQRAAQTSQRLCTGEVDGIGRMVAKAARVTPPHPAQGRLLQWRWWRWWWRWPHQRHGRDGLYANRRGAAGRRSGRGGKVGKASTGRAAPAAPTATVGRRQRATITVGCTTASATTTNPYERVGDGGEQIAERDATATAGHLLAALPRTGVMVELAHRGGGRRW